MKALVLVLWFVSFFLMLASVENLNCLFMVSFVTWGICSYLITYDKRFKIEKK